MTVTQMRAETELLYESINSSAAPGFIDAEWGIILTAAQRKVVIDILEEGVTRNSFNMLAIEKLIQPDSYTVFVADTFFKNSDDTSAQTIDIGSKTFETKFFWVLDEYVETAGVTNVPIKRISFDFYRTNIDNPFRKPNNVDGYWLLQYNNKPVFITDGTAVTKYSIMGVYHPDNYSLVIGGLCVLNEGVHSRIVEKAVKLARMSVEDPQGYQLALAEFAK
jgi:hypothetical protein